jgi:hypothetical protein
MSRFARVFVTITALIVSTYTITRADTLSADSTELVELFDHFMTHTQALEWDSAAVLMHPEGLERIKEIILSAYDALSASGQPTDAFLSCFDGVEDGAQLSEMPPHEFFVSMMNTIMRLPGIREMIAASETVYIGMVAENDTLVHAVYRTNLNYEGAFISDVEVATLRQFESRWTIGLSAEIEQFAEMFNQF